MVCGAGLRGRWVGCGAGLWGRFVGLWGRAWLVCVGWGWVRDRVVALELGCL